jgi:hypothetical protein
MSTRLEWAKILLTPITAGIFTVGAIEVSVSTYRYAMKMRNSRVDSLVFDFTTGKLSEKYDDYIQMLLSITTAKLTVDEELQTVYDAIKVCKNYWDRGAELIDLLNVQFSVVQKVASKPY